MPRDPRDDGDVRLLATTLHAPVTVDQQHASASLKVADDCPVQLWPLRQAQSSIPTNIDGSLVVRRRSAAVGGQRAGCRRGAAAWSGAWPDRRPAQGDRIDTLVGAGHPPRERPVDDPAPTPRRTYSRRTPFRAAALTDPDPDHARPCARRSIGVARRNYPLRRRTHRVTGHFRLGETAVGLDPDTLVLDRGSPRGRAGWASSGSF